MDTRYTSKTGKEANKKIKNRHKWTREEARKWGNVGVQMRLLNGSSRNQHTKGK